MVGRGSEGGGKVWAGARREKMGGKRWEGGEDMSET